MNRSASLDAPPAAAVLAAAAASGLVLAGCGSSTTDGSTASRSGSGQPAAAGCGPASTVRARGRGHRGHGLFPVAVGNTWVYQEKLTAAGTVTNKVVSVAPAAATGDHEEPQ